MVGIMGRFRQGFYTVINKDKYLGDPEKVFYRSSWEKKFCIWCDTNKSILRWNSEELVVPYIKPTDNRMHRYYVDFYIELKNTKGQIVKEAIEIKPYTQTKAPRKGNRKSLLNEQITFAVNGAKWSAAAKWCKARGVHFRVLTEKDLFR